MYIYIQGAPEKMSKNRAANFVKVCHAIGQKMQAPLKMASTSLPALEI